jgi:hypothetical protein
MKKYLTLTVTVTTNTSYDYQQLRKSHLDTPTEPFLALPLLTNGVLLWEKKVHSSTDQQPSYSSLYNSYTNHGASAKLRWFRMQKDNRRGV